MINSVKWYLQGIILKNTKIFKEMREAGFDYILNPETGELHHVQSDFLDSHNLHIANLENFIGLTNVGIIQVHRLQDGTTIPVYDLFSGQHIGDYVLNKCKHCFGSQN